MFVKWIGDWLGGDKNLKSEDWRIQGYLYEFQYWIIFQTIIVVWNISDHKCGLKSSGSPRWKRLLRMWSFCCFSCFYLISFNKLFFYILFQFEQIWYFFVAFYPPPPHYLNRINMVINKSKKLLPNFQKKYVVYIREHENAQCLFIKKKIFSI